MAIVLNQPRSARGKYFTIETSGGTLVHDLDADLVTGPAQAIAAAIGAGIKAISAAAAPATLRYRESVKRALANGSAWAQKRYPRGITSSTKLFEASGELESGITATVQGDTATITAPADRLGDLPGAAPGSTLQRLRALVPALENPFGDTGVRAALEATLSRLIQAG